MFILCHKFRIYAIFRKLALFSHYYVATCSHFDCAQCDTLILPMMIFSSPSEIKCPIELFEEEEAAKLVEESCALPLLPKLHELLPTHANILQDAEKRTNGERPISMHGNSDMDVSFSQVMMTPAHTHNGKTSALKKTHNLLAGGTWKTAHDGRLTASLRIPQDPR